MEISPLKYFSGDISAEISIEKSDWVSSDVFQLSRETIAKRAKAEKEDEKTLRHLKKRKRAREREREREV